MTMNKDVTIKFRCDQKFVNLLNQKLKTSNFNSHSELIRKSVENVRIKEQPKYVDKLRIELNRIGININQISKYVHTKKSFDNRVLLELNTISTNISLLYERVLNAR